MHLVRSEKGLSFVLILLAILAIGVASVGLTLSGFWFFNDKASEVTKITLKKIAIAVSGKNSKGRYGPRHYEEDVISLPNAFTDLITQPGGVANCGLDAQSATLHGWCGPYLINAYQGENLWMDGWGRNFVYDRNNRLIRSLGPNGTDENGGGDDLVQSF